MSLCSLKHFNICPVLEDSLTDVAFLFVLVTATLNICKPWGFSPTPNPQATKKKRKHTDCTTQVRRDVRLKKEYLIIWISRDIRDLQLYFLKACSLLQSMKKKYIYLYGCDMTYDIYNYISLRLVAYGGLWKKYIYMCLMLRTIFTVIYT